MKKITELKQVRWRTTHHRDAYGNLIKDKEEYTANRPVKSVSSGPRFGHFIIDFLAFQIVIYIVDYLFKLLVASTDFNSGISLTVGLISNIVLLLLYPALYAFCEYKWQKTPGKFLTKTIVIDEYGNKPELRAIILRSLIRLVPFEPFSCIGDDYSYGWHDRWAKTWVVTEDELAVLKKLQTEQLEES